MFLDLRAFSSELGHEVSDYFDTSNVSNEDLKELLSWLKVTGTDQFRVVIGMDGVCLTESLREAIRVAVATVHATLHPSNIE